MWLNLPLKTYFSVSRIGARSVYVACIYINGDLLQFNIDSPVNHGQDADGNDTSEYNEDSEDFYCI